MLKMIYVIVFIFFLNIQIGNSVIYRLNDTEYYKMPPIFHLDDYDSCLHQTNGTYCYVEIDLVSDTPSDLLQMIREYSEHTSNHFNYTQLHHGICLTKTCKHFLGQDKVLNTSLILEKCLNDTLWKDYKLKTRLSNIISCNKLNEPMDINVGDICAAVFFVCLGLLNVIGSLYGFYISKEGKGRRILLCFSVKHNFEKLVAQNQDPLRERLQGIHGIRTLSIMCIIFGHALLPFAINTENPHDLEKTYSDNVLLNLFYNGSLIVQTFFIMAGCLMAYNIRAYFDKSKLSWVLIPKAIMMRWLRLTPAYAVVLIFTLTWIRFIASGPLWEIAVGREVADCHRDGWLNMIYLNNYIDNSQCMAQTWYLAADMQLNILGLFVYILIKKSRTRNFVLLALFIIGALIPAIHTYLEDLNAIVLMAPEVARNFFVADPTFNHSYKRGHTNIPGFVLGLAVGNFVYKGLKNERKMEKFKKLGYLYYLTVPMGVGLLLFGMVFYGDKPRPSIYLRVLVSALLRPLYSLIGGIFFIGIVFKFENVYRKIVEWSGWRVPARVSYSAYLIHVAFVRIFAGTNTTLSRMGIVQCCKEAFAVIIITFLIAYPFWLFVEAPLNQAVVIILGLTKEDTKYKKTKIDDIGNTTIMVNQETTLKLENKISQEINVTL